MLKILALDQNLKTGWSKSDGTAGTLNIGEPRTPYEGTPALRLFRWLEVTIDQYQPDLIAFENFVAATMRFAGDSQMTIKAAVVMAAAARKVPIVQYMPASVKLAITGSGKADKGKMAAAVEKRLGKGAIPLDADDNAIDAIAIRLMAEQDFGDCENRVECLAQMQINAQKARSSRAAKSAKTRAKNKAKKAQATGKSVDGQGVLW